MRAFACDVCGNLLAFENSVCVACGTPMGFSVADSRLVPVPQDGSLVSCANLGIAACNWLVDGRLDGAVDAAGRLCRSCALTRTRPRDDDAEGLAAFARAETAKRRLVFQLLDLHLPVEPRGAGAGEGLAFDLLSSAGGPVTTGHADGVVTIDLAEGHDAHREARRVQLGEAYRTLLGHLRHEVGHYYWQVLAADADVLRCSREVFGDERADYAAALQRHYAQGPPLDWRERHVSAYAAAHPWEDWAETFAHYLHIRDTLQTAASYGLVLTGSDVAARNASLLALPIETAPPQSHPRRRGVQVLVDTWLPLTYALNAVNRSMGAGDLYPFVLTPTVVDKLDVVHTALMRRAGGA